MPKIARSDDTTSVSREDDLLVVELDERLEFGAVLIDSDLAADDNSACNNGVSCTASNNTPNCINHSSC